MYTMINCNKSQRKTQLSGWLTLDSCWPNSSSFCCNGVFSVSVSVISVLILPERNANAIKSIEAHRNRKKNIVGTRIYKLMTNRFENSMP